MGLKMILTDTSCVLSVDLLLDALTGLEDLLRTTKSDLLR
jgi:hypothetical protein